jgi:hypothetical protein
MADNTILYQGKFTADGNNKTIRFRGDIDWMRVYNATVLDAGGAGSGCEYFWQKGMTDDTGIIWTKLAADDSTTIDMMTANGFSYINTQTTSALGAINSTVTAISNAAIPIVSATSTTTLEAGDIVRFVNVTGAQQFGGVDFEIDTVVANTSFRLVYAPQIVAGTNGSFYPVNIPRAFYPKRRFISKITAANPAVVTTTVSHGYTVGQQVRMKVPSGYGMTQMDGLVATITAVTASTFTTDIDASAFTAFAWPLTAAAPFTHAQVVPFGESSEDTYINLTGDATDDQGYIGMILKTGTDSPAGVITDVIYWQAGKAFSVNNE